MANVEAAKRHTVCAALARIRSRVKEVEAERGAEPCFPPETRRVQYALMVERPAVGMYLRNIHEYITRRSRLAASGTTCFLYGTLQVLKPTSQNCVKLR
jgi:hypothetical protein